MRKQKRNKAKYDINKVTIKRTPRKMTLQNALKLAIKNGKAMAENIQKWIDENEYDETFVLSLHADGIYTHLYCETDANEPFPMIFYRLNSDLDGVARATMGEISLIKASIDPTSIQEGLELEILPLMFIQKDRRDTFNDSVKKYELSLKEERKISSNGNN